MNNKGYSLLEIIVALTIFSIFIASVSLAFSTYIEVSKKNNTIANERVFIVSNLEMFLSKKEHSKKDKTITLVKKNGLKEIDKQILCIEKEEKSSKTGESFKAFVKK